MPIMRILYIYVIGHVFDLALSTGGIIDSFPMFSLLASFMHMAHNTEIYIRVSVMSILMNIQCYAE
jgi:hypothetical protein